MNWRMEEWKNGTRVSLFVLCNCDCGDNGKVCVGVRFVDINILVFGFIY